MLVTPFISYAREDQFMARRLYLDLKALGATPWRDIEELVPGDDWEPKVREAVRESSHFIALISANSVNKRGFVQKELRQAVDILDEFPPGHSFIIPVRLDDSVPSHERLNKIQWLNLFPSYADALLLLAKAIGLPSQSRANAFARITTAALQLVPANVASEIRGRADREQAVDEWSRMDLVGREVCAWLELSQFCWPGIPDNVGASIVARVRSDLPGLYAAQYFRAYQEALSWIDAARPDASRRGFSLFSHKTTEVRCPRCGEAAIYEIDDDPNHAFASVTCVACDYAMFDAVD